MELQIPIIFTTSILTLNLAKISHLILSIQAIVVTIVSIIFMHTNITYLAYALIYVYIGAICVLFLYFMMLLQNRWEVHGRNSLFIFTVIIGIEIISYSLSYIITHTENYNQEIGIILNEKSYELKSVIEALELEGLKISLVVMLLVIGVIIPIFLTNLSLKSGINYKNPLGEITQSRINLIANFLGEPKKFLRSDLVTVKIGVLLAFGKDAYKKIIEDPSPSVNFVELDIFKSITIYLAEHTAWDVDVDTVKFYMVLLLQLLCLVFINFVLFFRNKSDSNTTYKFFLKINHAIGEIGARLLDCLGWVVGAVVHMGEICYLKYINNNKRRPTLSNFNHKIPFFIGYILFIWIIYIFGLAGAGTGISIENANILPLPLPPEDPLASPGVPKSISISTPAPAPAPPTSPAPTVAVAIEVENVAVEWDLNPINWFNSAKSRMQPTLVWWKNSGRDAIASRDFGLPYSIPKGLPRGERELTERFFYGPRLNRTSNFLPAEFNNYPIPSPAEIAFGQRIWNNIYNLGMSLVYSSYFSCGHLVDDAIHWIMELFDSSNRISLQGFDLVYKQYSNLWDMGMDMGINLWNREIFNGVSLQSSTDLINAFFTVIWRQITPNSPNYFTFFYEEFRGLDVPRIGTDRSRTVRWLQYVYYNLFRITGLDFLIADWIRTQANWVDIYTTLSLAERQYKVMEGVRHSIHHGIDNITPPIPHPRDVLIGLVLNNFFGDPAHWPKPHYTEYSFQLLMNVFQRDSKVIQKVRDIIDQNYQRCVPDIFTAFQFKGPTWNPYRYRVFMPCFRLQGYYFPEGVEAKYSCDTIYTEEFPRPRPQPQPQPQILTKFVSFITNIVRNFLVGLKGSIS